MESKLLIALGVMSVLVAFSAGNRLPKLRHMDGTFFMSKELKKKYNDIIIQDRDDDVITAWTAGEGQQSNETHACPWTYVMISNKNRIPQTHLEAQCLTQHCLDLTKNTYIPNERPLDQDNNLSFLELSRCTKVQFGKWVKVRRMTPSGLPKYDKRILMVAAACSCQNDVRGGS